jgi:hypothetical protein
MNSTFDIFRGLSDGYPAWLEAVQGFEEAKRRLSSLASTSPGEYFVYSVGQKAVVASVTSSH